MDRYYYIKKIFLVTFIFSLCFLSCEEPDDPALPYEPSDVKIMGRTISSLDVFWTEAPFDDFDRYEVCYRKYYESDFSIYSSIPSKRQQYITISGLSPDTEYKIIIKSIDKKGTLLKSKELSQKTLSDVPSPFDRFTYSEIGHNYVTLSWSSYKDSYAVPFSRYAIYMSKSPNFQCNDSNLVLIIDNVNTTLGTIGNLGDKSNYYFKARVYNKLEKFRESVEYLLKTKNAPPDPVEFYGAYDITESSALLKWQKSMDPEFDYYSIHLDYDLNFVPSTRNRIGILQKPEDTTLLLTGLKKGDGGIFKIVVYDIYSDYAISNPVGFNAFKDGIPEPTEIIGLIPSSEKSEIRLVWEPSEIKIFARYDLYMSTDSVYIASGGGLVQSVNKKDVFSYTFPSLKRQTNYFFRIAVVDPFGRRGLSEIKSCYLP